MLTYKVQSNALPKIRNVMEMVSGTLDAPVSRSVVNEMSLLIGDIARVSMYKFIDGAAKINPKKLHHVYEWNKTGNMNHRLYFITDPVVGRAYRSKTFIQLNVTYRQSKIPVPRTGFPKEKTQVFKNKAEIMEKGKRLRIKPKNGKYLVFLAPENRKKRGRKSLDSFIFSKAVTISNPGGKEVRSGLSETIIAFSSVDLDSKLFKNNVIRNLEKQWERSAGGIPYNQASGRTYQATHHRNMTKQKTALDLIKYLRATRYQYKVVR